MNLCRSKGDGGGEGGPGEGKKAINQFEYTLQGLGEEREGWWPDSLNSNNVRTSGKTFMWVVACL